MAPATVAGASPARSRGGWDRDEVLIAIREWVATYGEPPRAADWNPSSARWSGQLWRVERYRAGRADGSAWPALNSAKRPFSGSLSAAVRAAGFEPARPGPRRRSDVDLAQADRVQMSPEARALLDAATARARAAEAQLARATARPAPKPKPKTKRVVDTAALTRAQRRVDAAAAKADEAVRAASDARMDAAEARGAAGRLSARLERAEATVATLRGERRELRAELARGADRLAAAERLLAATRAEADRAPEVEVVRVREPSPQAAELRAARDEAARCRRIAEAAELRAARAERELAETVAAVRGEPRRLTPDELRDLRTDGPAGPAVLATALRELAAARRTTTPTRLRAALRRVAEAAVTWQERI